MEERDFICFHQHLFDCWCSFIEFKGPWGVCWALEAVSALLSAILLLPLFV